MALEGLQGLIASIGEEQVFRYWAYMAWSPMFYQVGEAMRYPDHIDDFLKISCWYYHLQLFVMFVQLWLLIHHPKTSTLDPDCEEPAKVLL